MSPPTKATPAGCVVGFFGLASWAYAGLCGYALRLAYNLPEVQRDAALVHSLWLRLPVAFVIGLALVWYGWRMAMVADMRHPDDPPSVRF